MDRDEAMALTAQVAALQATVEVGLFNLDRRMDSQNRKLERIEEQVTLTNGRVNTLENKDQFRADGEAKAERMANNLPPLNWHTLQKLAQFGGWIVAGVMGWLSLTGKL